jgi:DNA-binding ferritin-like protein (Dps family)
MNFKGKNKLYLLVILTLLFMAQTVIYLTKVDSIKTGEITILILLIVFAIIGIFIALYRLRVVKQRIKTLSPQYKEIYLQADEIVNLSAMKRVHKKETMVMILEIFEHASLQNRDVNSVIGGNLEQFISGFISVSAGRPTLLYLISYSSFLYIIYLLFMKLYLIFRSDIVVSDILQTEPLDLGIILTYGIIAFVFFPWMMLTTQRAAQKQWRGLKKILLLLPFTLPFLLILLLIKVDNSSFIIFIDTPVPIFTNYYTISLGIILLVVLFRVMRFAQNRELRKVITE